MDNEHGELALELDPPGIDAEKLAAMVQRLRSELPNLDGDSIEVTGVNSEGRTGSLSSDRSLCQPRLTHLSVDAR